MMMMMGNDDDYSDSEYILFVELQATVNLFMLFNWLISSYSHCATHTSPTS